MVIMNWKRPANVKQILDAMVNYRAVKEIIVWHCNRDTIFYYTHAKVLRGRCSPPSLCHHRCAALSLIHISEPTRPY